MIPKKVSLREVSKYGVFSGPYFPAFGLNTGRYSVTPYSVRMWENRDQEKLRIWTLFTQCLLQLVANVYSNFNDDYMFKVNKLESTLCNDCDSNNRCIGECQNLNTSRKVVYVLQLSDALVVLLNVFRHIDYCNKLMITFIKKFIPILT